MRISFQANSTPAAPNFNRISFPCFLQRSKSSTGIWDSTFTGVRPDWAKTPFQEQQAVTNGNGVHNGTAAASTTGVNRWEGL